MKLKELFTPPNFLTLARLLLIPYFLLLMLDVQNTKAIVIFLVMIATDILDGRIARRRNQATTFGAAFDLGVDTTLLFSGLITLVSLGKVSLLQFVFLTFAASLKGIGLYLIYHKTKTIPVPMYAKLNGFSIGFILFWYLFGFPYLSWYVYVVIAFTFVIGVIRNYQGLEVLLRA